MINVIPIINYEVKKGLVISYCQRCERETSRLLMAQDSEYAIVTCECGQRCILFQVEAEKIKEMAHTLEEMKEEYHE